MAEPSNDMMDDPELDGRATPSRSTSSIGEAVSGRGQSRSDEEEDIFYIPERRPSLDLGPSPMDTSHWQYVDQVSPPALSYGSMTSEDNLVNMDDEDGSSTRVQLDRAESFSSCYSFDSDDCEKKIPKAKGKEETVPVDSDKLELIYDPDEVLHPSVTVAFTFKAICKTLTNLPEVDLLRFKMRLWRHFPQSFNTPPQGLDLVDLVDRLLECYDLQMTLRITRTILQSMGQKKMVNFLHTLCLRNEIRYDLGETLKKKYGEVCEDSGIQGEKRPLEDAFTNLFITSTCDNGPNIEHEVMTIPKLDSNREEGKLLSTEDILSAKRLERSHLKLLLIIGAPGSGKSTMIRKLILDWVAGRSHQHIDFLLPVSFRELKQYEGQTFSLLQVIHTLYPATKKMREEEFRCEDCKIMFIFEGLDEYDGKLDFHNTRPLSEPANESDLNILVVNILRGRMLYRGLFVVTSRSPVKRYVPWDTPHDEIDLLGFRDPEREEYFRKRFTDADQAAKVIAYINSVKTLRIMCHLPLFCSLVADEHQRLFREQGTQAELPRSITYMYTKLLLLLMRQLRRFRAPDRSPDKERDFLMKLGKLAFNMLEKGEFKLTKYDWKELGHNDIEAVINSGLCVQYITKPYVLSQDKTISFIHPTMQEYLAALYAFLSLRNQGKNVFDQQLKQKVKGILKANKMMELYKSAVDKSLQCEDGKLDIFLRFLFGMGVKTNQELLQPFCGSGKWPTFVEEASALIRKRIKENQQSARADNLKRCLEELGVRALEAADSF